MLKQILVVGLVVVFTFGCINLNDCGSSTNCFFNKLDSCEVGARLHSSDSDRPSFVEIIEKADEECKIKYLSRPEEIMPFLYWTEKELVEHVCILKDYQDIVNDDGMANEMWLVSHLKDTNMSSVACMGLAADLATKRNREYN